MHYVIGVAKQIFAQRHATLSFFNDFKTVLSLQLLVYHRFQLIKTNDHERMRNIHMKYASHTELFPTFDNIVFIGQIKELFTRTVHLDIRIVRDNP